MTKLTLAFALLLTGAAAAHAQIPTPSDAQRQPMSDRDPIHREETHIASSRNSSSSLEREANASRRHPLPTMKAVVEVTNHAAKEIKFVTWTATLTDPLTGAVIDSYDVKTKARIAPGSTKKLSKRLKTSRNNVVNASSAGTSSSVIYIKVEVTGVTYADGSTAVTP